MLMPFNSDALSYAELAAEFVRERASLSQQMSAGAAQLEVAQRRSASLEREVRSSQHEEAGGPWLCCKHCALENPGW